MGNTQTRLRAPLSQWTNDQSIETLLAGSEGADGHACLSDTTKVWLGDLAAQLPDRFWIYHDAAASRRPELFT